MTMPENSRFGAALGAGREGERLRPLPELAAAPITVVCLLETTSRVLEEFKKKLNPMTIPEVGKKWPKKSDIIYGRSLILTF